MFVGRKTIEVGWGDCDPARIVFFPRYFVWFEDCTAAFFAEAGLPLARLFAERGMVGIPLVDAGATFHRPSAYGDVLECETSITQFGTKSFRIGHRFFREGQLAVEGYTVRVWAMPDPTGARPLRAVPVPEDVVRCLSGSDVVEVA